MSLSDEVRNALRRAFSLGQTYWQQADSEYTSQHRKADETSAKFEHLVIDTCAAIESAALAEAMALFSECDEYLNTNDLTSISHGSILHRKMRALLATDKAIEGDGK